MDFIYLFICYYYFRGAKGASGLANPCNNLVGLAPLATMSEDAVNGSKQRRSLLAGTETVPHATQAP